MTPMNPNSVRERYQIPSGDDEEAHEDTETSMEPTTTLEDGMEQLLAKGSNESRMTTIDEGSKDVSGSPGPSFFGGEKTAELETNVMSLIQPTEDTAFSLPSLSSVSSVSNRESLTQSLNRSNESEDMSIVEPTRTMQLEGTVASLLNGGQGNNFPREDSKTMDLEGTLASLLDKRDEKVADDETLPSISSPLKRIQGKEESQTVNIEGTMASLLEGADEESANPIDSIGHMPQSDDTVSELGMNTASHELRSVREVRREPPLQTIVDTPPEPVNLKLDELIDFGEVGLKLVSQAEDDILIQALDLASGATYRPILGASDRILSSICEEIEGQCSSDDFESEFEAAIKANEGPMRSLQARVRNKTDHEIREQIQLLKKLSSENEVFSNWQPWLLQVVEVYHNELEGCLGEMQNEKAEISEKSASIDQVSGFVSVYFIRSLPRLTIMPTLSISRTGSRLLCPCLSNPRNRRPRRITSEQREKCRATSRICLDLKSR